MPLVASKRHGVVTAVASTTYNPARNCQKLSELLKGLSGSISGNLRLLEHKRYEVVDKQRARLMAKQTKITIETDSLLILRGRTPLRGGVNSAAERKR